MSTPGKCAYLSKRLFLWAGISCALIFLWSGCLPRHVLRISNLSDNNSILERPVRPGDNFWVVFINSVENLPVADHFKVDENYRLLFTETIYQAPYVGYDHEEKARVIAPGTVRIADIDKPMETVSFFAGHDSRHMLFLNGNFIPLYPPARGGDLIQIEIIERRR